MPANTEEGTFSPVTNETSDFSGTTKVWESGSCAYAYMTTMTATLAGDTMTVDSADALPNSFTFTRVGTASASGTQSRYDQISWCGATQVL